MNKYKTLLGFFAFLNAPNTEEITLLGNEAEYNKKKEAALHSYCDFHEANAQKTLKSGDINFDYFKRGIQEAKNDMIEALPNAGLNNKNIDFNIVIKQNIENKKVFIYIAFFAYCDPCFTHYVAYINSVPQSTQNLINIALEKINA
ncbi:hypothetical protein [Alphaproteobacteria bacterium endosymbiont of Tiliacea citrago]|uniref:hypothetical protein n=1 Tax=Alphaproteobacteria bacterium endosymbiont of Tiliacea citrago TaxID=3077944 RepID=UPI00313D60F1